MLKLRPNYHLIQSSGELPEINNFTSLYLDVETTSFSVKRPGDRPFHGDRICGLAVTWDDNQDIYYIPVRHYNKKWNIEPDQYKRWLKNLLGQTSGVWKNSNIKFDAHFCAQDGAEFKCELHDTNVAAKLFDSDRYSHSLKGLVRDWLDIETETDTRRKTYMDNFGTKDYGYVPADKLGEYACDDVHYVRELDRFLHKKMPEESSEIWRRENLLTPVLYDMEKRGFRVDPQELQIESIKSLRIMLEANDFIHETTGKEFTDSSDWCHDLFHHQWGIPVLQWNFDKKKGRVTGPSYDKDALKLYEGRPEIRNDPKKQEVINQIRRYRKEEIYKGMFVESYMKHRDVNNRVHPDFNQIVRTGRMSCRRPNTQQLNKRAKRLVKGNFLSADASQIEFRLICHYTKDEDAIAAYRDNPDTDFHQWMADLCGIKRPSAKNINFGVSYGAGKVKITKMLSSDESILEEVGAVVEAEIKSGELNPKFRNARFLKLVELRASDAYDTYHSRFPKLKKTMNLTRDVCKYRGYIRNIYGRRRHLPTKAAHNAFNSLIQGCAMDYIKGRMIATSSRYNEWYRDRDIHLVLNVHDEVVYEDVHQVLSNNEQDQQMIVRDLETQDAEFRVPFTWEHGYSTDNWMEAVA